MLIRWLAVTKGRGGGGLGREVIEVKKKLML